MRPRIRSDIAEEIIETGSLTSFKAIDTHAHMGHFRGIHFPNPMAADMVATCDRAGVEWVACAHHDALQNPETGNPKAQEAIDAFPDRILGYYCVNPNYAEQLAEAVAGFGQLRGFAGYKILAGYYKAPITLPACEPLWRQAHDEKLAVLLHTWGGDTNAGVKQVHEIASRYPEARILMGHSQYGQWDDAIKLCKDHPNVYCELCAAYGVNGVLEKMVNAGIERRVTMGTDLPWFDPQCCIGCVVFADINDTARRRILRDNAAEIYARWI